MPIRYLPTYPTLHENMHNRMPILHINSTLGKGGLVPVARSGYICTVTLQLTLCSRLQVEKRSGYRWGGGPHRDCPCGPRSEATDGVQFVGLRRGDGLVSLTGNEGSTQSFS